MPLSISLIEVTKCLVTFKIQPSYIIREEGGYKKWTKDVCSILSKLTLELALVSNIETFYVRHAYIEISHFSSGIVV